MIANFRPTGSVPMALLTLAFLVCSGCSPAPNADEPAVDQATLTRFARELRHEDLSVRSGARLALTRRGAIAVPYLRDALLDKNREVRLEAVVGLSNMKDPERVEALPELVRTLQDDWWLIRLNALIALGSMGPPARRTAEAVQQLMTDEKSSVRELASETLVRLQGVEALPHLIEALKDDRSRPHAAQALGKLGPQAVPALREWSASRNPVIQKAVTDALARIEGVPVD